MEDKQILSLYRNRDEGAIEETAKKYSGYCAGIAGNILDVREDIEEVLNDTWLRAWSTIPPENPVHLKLYLARIARNLSYDRFRSQSREKRGGGVITVALEELAECIPARGQPSDALDAKELRVAVNRFLGKLPERDRQVFLRRYFRVEATEVIAQAMGVRETGVRTILSRTRKKLKRYLEKEDLYYE